MYILKTNNKNVTGSKTLNLLQKAGEIHKYNFHVRLGVIELVYRMVLV